MESGCIFFFFNFCFQGVNSIRPLKASISAWLTNDKRGESKSCIQQDKTTHTNKIEGVMRAERKDKNQLGNILFVFSLSLIKTDQGLVRGLYLI